MVSTTHARGFTLIEIAVAVAIIAILGALAVLGYQHYIERARGTELVEKYDAIRTAVAARAQAGTADDCAEFAKGLDRAALVDPHASLTYRFEPVSAGGYRPVLNVCAKVDANGTTGVSAARGAQETLAKNGVVDNAFVSESVVSYSLRLTQGNQAYCKTYTAQTTEPCGPPSPVAAACPPGKERFVIPGSGTITCITSCQPGQTRDQSLNCMTPADSSTPPTVPGPSPAGDPAAVTAAVQAIPAVQSLPQAERTTVVEAVQKMMSDANYAKAINDALAQAKPGEAVGVPATDVVLRDFGSRCPATRLGPPWPAADGVVNGACQPSMTAHCNDCSVAKLCPVSCGLTKGISPEMQAALDASWKNLCGSGCGPR